MAERAFTKDSFDKYLQEKKLMGVKCPRCEKLYLPPRPYCPQCLNWEMEWHEFRGRGKLAAFTAISVAPSFMVDQGYGRNNPYCCGVVQLDEGPGISGLLLGVDATNPEGIKIGMPVEVEFAESDAGETKRVSLAFRPVRPY